MVEGFKNADAGIIPNDWITKSIEDLCIPNGVVRGPFGGALKKSFFVPHGYKVYEQKNAIYSDVNLGDYYINYEKFNELRRFEVKEKDFIISCSGTIGRISQIPKNFEKGVINQALLKLTIDSYNYSEQYFLQYFRWDNFQKIIVDNTQGGAMKNLIGMSDFKKTLIPLPPTKAEQTAIATALNDADALIQKLEQLIAKKRNIKTGAMQELLKPKEDWEVKKLGEVTDIIRGGSPRPIEAYLTKDVDGINWIKIGDVDKAAKYIFSTEERIIPKGAAYSRTVKEGDFLLSNSMSFGRPYILKTSGCVHDGWLVIQNYHGTFDTNFLYYLLGFETTLNQYKNLAAGSTVLNLNKEIVTKVSVSYPNLEEQTRIAEILSDMDNEIQELETQLEKYKMMKQGMMQSLLTGKIRLVK
jgi:type I restriction enzyme S subunit